MKGMQYGFVQRLFRYACVACLLSGTAVTATAEIPKHFTAKYEASFKGVPITAKRSLKALDNGLLELRFSADSWVANISEFSHFHWGEQGRVVPKNYEYHRQGLGRDRHAVLSFNWEDRRVINNVQNKPWEMDLPEEALDKLSYQIQLRRDLLNNKKSGRYTVADGGKIKHYLFEVVGEEVLQTPVGRLNTIKVKRVRENSNKRLTYLWLAKDWDLLVVRISQQEKDGKPYEIILANAKIDGKPVKGF